MNWFQNEIIDVKSAKWNEARQQNFPSSFPEFPTLLCAYTDGIDYKQQEEYSMNRSKLGSEPTVVKIVLERE